MKTQQRLHRLAAGQALALPRGTARPLVLAEGELLMQGPALWLAGSVVLPAPVRLVAPAALPVGGSESFVAVRPSSVVVDEPVPLLSLERLRALAMRIRGLPRRSSSAVEECAAR